MQVIEELRKTRLEKNITLQDISAATRINVRFLEAIEQGEFDILPKPYVKAFIKQYARHIGFDEQKIIELFEEYKKQAEPQESGEKSDTVKSKAPDISFSTPKLKNLFLSLAVLGGIALIIYLGISVFDSPEETVAERPFQDVVREIEEHADRTSIEPVDSLLIRRSEPVDSVSLAVTAIDTVWLTITVDNVMQNEYIFPPGRSQQWKAANGFLMTVGNAGGVSVTINDDSIGVLGNPGQVLRNLQITHDGIQR